MRRMILFPVIWFFLLLLNVNLFAQINVSYDLAATTLTITTDHEVTFTLTGTPDVPNASGVADYYVIFQGVYSTPQSPLYTQTASDGSADYSGTMRYEVGGESLLPSFAYAGVNNMLAGLFGNVGAITNRDIAIAFTSTSNTTHFSGEDVTLTAGTFSFRFPSIPPTPDSQPTGFLLVESQTGTSISTQGVFPVELTSFSASLNGKAVQLNWKTATEVNNYGFEVEKKMTGSNVEWSKIGFVKGSGNSNSVREYSFTDKQLSDKPSTYRLKQIDNDGTFEYSKIIEVSAVPSVFALEQNYPNPFNPATNIKYIVPDAGLVTLKVFDILGNEVAVLVNEQKQPGTYEIEFNGSSLSSGVYYYTMTAGNFSATKKLLLVK